ncbi:carbohydrate kinase family protein [Acidisoma cladoniae]|jgi:sugar/nucleoside kinase (ribokinase family)|uniref:carbohydrate kinase family protein n=1 Tax=Acidisoma cladoniae TaxID=3040935 RepID=UPI00254D91A7|nr:sugar kinase [Acidisoma sp. PAMC 29798]
MSEIQTKPTHDVSVIGLYCIDILGRPVRGIPDGANADFIEEIRLTVAGTAGGTIVDCAKLGMKALAVGAVGEDEKGRFILSTLESFGIDTSGLQRHAGVHTAASILAVRPNGERPCLHVRGASDVLTLVESDYAKVLDARFVHMGGNGLLGKMDGEPTRALLAAAKAAGRITTFDLIFATAPLMAKIAPAMQYVDYFAPSIEEATALCGHEKPEDAAQYFHDLGVHTCVLTMGGDGCFVSTPDTTFRLPAHDIKVVDTTGCGDAFTGGLIAALHQGWDIEQAARFAGTCGALVAGGLGSDAGIIDFKSTEASMHSLPVKH